MTYLGIVLLILGVVLWLTVAPSVGYVLTILGVTLVIIGVVLSAHDRGGRF